MSEQMSHQEMVKVAQKLAYERIQLEEQITNLNNYIDQLKQQHHQQIENAKGSNQIGSYTSRTVITLINEYNTKIAQLEQQFKQNSIIQQELHNENKILQQTNNVITYKNQDLNQQIASLKQQMYHQQEQHKLDIQKINNGYQDQISSLSFQKTQLECTNKSLIQKDILQNDQQEQIQNDQIAKINLQLSNQKDQIEQLKRELGDLGDQNMISSFLKQNQ